MHAQRLQTSANLKLIPIVSSTTHSGGVEIVAAGHKRQHTQHDAGPGQGREAANAEMVDPWVETRLLWRIGNKLHQQKTHT